MCGIAGIINYKNYNLEKMRDTLLHRGPDEQNIYCEDNIALIHTRLSIVDIKSASQPMHRQHCSLIYNGEIYNHNHLRKMCNDFNFSTKSDTEVILALYLLYGEKMFQHIDGMFAFAILDRKKNQIFLSRDRAGKKPLYYTIQNDSFLFASELNALKAAIELKPEIKINDEAIAAYIRCGFFPAPTTPYENMYELEAGHSMAVNIASLNIKKQSFFSIADIYPEKNNPNKISLNESIEKLDNLLDISVKDRLLSSDLEVGIFLSGGIDSSLIAAKASKYRSHIKTFTITFDGDYDESHLARLTAAKYQTDHHEIKISLNLKKDIEKILLSYGKPFMDSSAIPSYYVSKAAKEHLTVVLNGDGADEMFAGYRRYVPIANNWLNKAKKLSFLKALMPKPNQKKSYYNYLYRMLDTASKKSGLSLYLSLTTDIFEGYEQNIIESKLLHALDNNIKTIFQNNRTNLSQILTLDFNIALACDLLQKMDIASMANSLETRSPFLSKYILEFAPTLPDNFKIRGITTKFILRKLAVKYLPSQLINQPKRGFEVPLKFWIENDIKDVIFDTLSTGCYSENFVNKTFLKSLLAKKVNISDEKRAKILWTLFCLEIWKANL